MKYSIHLTFNTKNIVTGLETRFLFLGGPSGPTLKHLGTQTEIRWPEHVYMCIRFEKITGPSGPDFKIQGAIWKIRGPMSLCPLNFKPCS